MSNTVFAATLASFATAREIQNTRLSNSTQDPVAKRKKSKSISTKDMLNQSQEVAKTTKRAKVVISKKKKVSSRP